uniref:Uncharacterized protein n=1 Tax=viral metagenome TaxID=1070528 RepID=A0A6M3IP38_9ZZZZ
MANGINALIAQGGGNLPQAPNILGMQRNALINQRMQIENQMLPEQQNWARQEMTMKQKSFELDQKLKEFEIENRPLIKESKGLQLLQSLAGSGAINTRNFDRYKDFLSKKGINPRIFEGVPSGDEQKLNKWLEQISLSSAQRLEILKTQSQQRPYKPGQEITREEGGGKGTYRVTGYDERGMPITEKIAESKKQESRTELEKTVEKYNSLPPGGEKQFYLARIKKLTETTGMKLTVDKDGNITFTQGALGKEGFEGLSKKTQGQIEEKLLSGREQLSRMEKIAEGFKPDFLEIGTRLQNAWTGIKAKLGRNVSKQDSSSLIDFKKFQRKAIENINLYIKELTGAQMSEKEAARLRLAQPDPGENWWQGDDPITFKSKMEDVLKSTRAGIARYEYYKAKGLSDTEIKGLVSSDKAIKLDEITQRIE